MKAETIMDVYKLAYIDFGSDITIDQARKYFDISCEKLFKLVFLNKYRMVAQKYETRLMNQRVNNARHRNAWWGSVMSTDDKSINAQTAIVLLKEQNFRCNICDCYLVKSKEKQLDHIKPVSKGGEHKIGNVQWLCKVCNLKKGNKYEN